MQRHYLMKKEIRFWSFFVTAPPRRENATFWQRRSHLKSG
jgi:hypothetical protein